jgi:hypothetical protein
MGVVCYFNHCDNPTSFPNRAGLYYKHLQGLKTTYKNPLHISEKKAV